MKFGNRHKRTLNTAFFTINHGLKVSDRPPLMQRVMLRNPGVTSSCVNIQHFQSQAKQRVCFLKVRGRRAWMGLHCRECTADAGSWISHSLTIEEIICTAFVSIPWPLIKRLDYRKIKASSFKPILFMSSGYMRLHLLLSGPSSKSTTQPAFLLISQMAGYRTMSYFHRCVFNL